MTPPEVQAIQQVVDCVTSRIDPDWQAFAVRYHVDGGHSQSGVSFLVDRAGSPTEVGIAAPSILDDAMRQLRSAVPGPADQRFSRCDLKVTRDGRFTTHYGYDPVDWDAVMAGSWLFPEVARKA